MARALLPVLGLVGFLAAVPVLARRPAPAPGGAPFATEQPPPGPVHPPAPLAAPARAAYIGSAACGKCHPTHFAGWKGTVHPLQERPATLETVIGDFETGETLDLDGIPVRPFRRGERFFVETVGADGKPADFALERVIGGSMYKQRYLTRVAGGAEAVLPLEWNMAARRFQPYHAQSGYKPGQAEFWGGPSRAWALRCAGCHVVGLELTPPAGPGEWPQARFVELGIGCESCHGPGGAHAADPQAPGSIVNPAKLSQERAYAICASCHARGLAGPEEGAPVRVEFPLAFRPGDRDIHRFFRFSEPLEGLSSWAFWANKQSRQHHQQANDFERSAHFTRAGMSCIDCHASHERLRYAMLRKDPRNELCVSCHTDRATPERLEAHTRHAAGSAGSICIECHMPKTVTHANPNELRAHTQWRPKPDIDARLRVPEACTLCHKDRSREWAAETVDRWKFGAKKGGD